MVNAMTPLFPVFYCFRQGCIEVKLIGSCHTARPQGPGGISSDLLQKVPADSVRSRRAGTRPVAGNEKMHHTTKTTMSKKIFNSPGTYRQKSGSGPGLGENRRAATCILPGVRIIEHNELMAFRQDFGQIYEQERGEAG